MLEKEEIQDQYFAMFSHSLGLIMFIIYKYAILRLKLIYRILDDESHQEMFRLDRHERYEKKHIF